MLTAEQLATIRTAQKQLLDLGDENTAATLAWALTAELDLDPTPKDYYARLHYASCEALGAIADSLGINSDIDGGADPILEGIEDLRKLAGYADMHVFEMDDCEWWIGPSRYACLFAFAGEYDAEVTSDEIAANEPPLTAEQLTDLPFYTDGEPTRTFADQLAIERAKGGVFPRLFASSES